MKDLTGVEERRNVVAIDGACSFKAAPGGRMRKETASILEERSHQVIENKQGGQIEPFSASLLEVEDA